MNSTSVLGTGPAALAVAAEQPVAAVTAQAATPVALQEPVVTSQSVAAPQASGQTVTVEQSLRQGLPRVVGEEHWPLSATALVQQFVPTAEAEHAPVAEASAVEQIAATPPSATVASATAQPVQSRPTVAKLADSKLTGSKPVQPGPPLLANKWAKVALVGIGLIVVAAIAVLATRMFLSSDGGQSFLSKYPGEYHLPETAPVGFPAWLGWQHFLNVFLMVLIIRSGIQIRGETRPKAFWTPNGKSGGKVSLTIWFHQSVDLLWLINGVVFMVLLFATGQWMRVIPTSWEVFPNAISAGLQYMSLDWPTDNGWVNYNSLQQLAYFTTIFIAAPLAAATGFRMSGMWPKRATKLSAIYPMELARKIHFPVMLYFVAFILVHVALVLSTGALRNLNHMYAAQGSVDPTEYANNWFGFWMFVVSLAVIVGAALAARPFILAPIASLFGKVSSR
ncbi:cytochrome b/b6 domain-containing protein [Glutamicibacter uratoxydans]|uniref:cytochrome b/b6 domain-containing protein n=1 Tax=Glutamicibacter uratoxydans TaxID=43667 RepID=UPI003D700005